MYPASHQLQRSLTRSRRSNRARPLIEPLEHRALLSSSALAWARIQPYGSDILADAAGNVYTTDGVGHLQKFDSQGAVAWTAPADFARVSALTSNSVYTQSGINFSRYSVTDGALIWSKRVPPAVTEMAVAPDGTVHMIGTFTSSFDADPGEGTFVLSPSAGGPDVALITFDASGDFVRAQAVGAGSDPTVRPQVAVDGAGNVITAVTYDVATRPPLNPGHVRLTKFSPGGTVFWNYTVGSTDTTARDLAVSPSGDILIGGATPITADLDPGTGTAALVANPFVSGNPTAAYAASYAADGSLRWLRAVHPNAIGVDPIDVYDVDLTPSGNAAVVARVDHPAAGATGFIRTFNSAGSLTGDQVYSVANNVALGRDGADLFVSGLYQFHNTDFDPGPGTYFLGSTFDQGFLTRLTTDFVKTDGRLVGTPIGTSGSWNNSGNTLVKALDNDPSTYFDASSSQAWVGYDFGSRQVLTSAAVTPRAGLAWRAVGGKIQASNDGVNWDTLVTITSEPSANGSTYPISDPTGYQYARYLSPEGGYGNIAELSFTGIGSALDVIPPTTPAYPNLHATDTQIVFDFADLASDEDGYLAQLSSTADFSTPLTQIIRRPVANITSISFDNPGPGTWYARVRAFSDFGDSGWLYSGPVTTGEPTPAAPTNVVASGGGNSLNLSWTDNATNETGYQVQLSTSPTFDTLLTTRNLPPNSTFEHFAGYSSGVTYYFRVRAVNSTGPSTFYSDYATDSFYLPPVESDFRVAGTLIGTAGSWAATGNDKAKAVDNDTSTYFDAPTGEAWVGFDLGTAQHLDHVRFYPRAGLAWRMVDGRFQGSNDDVNWDTIATISTQPAEGQFTTLSLVAGSNHNPYRYVRYLSAPWGYGNVAELEFYRTTPPGPTPPPTPANFTARRQGSELRVEWTDISNNETGFEIDVATDPEFTSILRHAVIWPNTSSVNFSALPAGTYYTRIRAINDAGGSPYATAAPVILPVGNSFSQTGIQIGTAGSWNNVGDTLAKAFDGNLDTYFDAPTSQAWVGYDFERQVTLTSIYYAPRTGLGWRMVGGTFQGSNDGVNWNTFATIPTEPADGVRTGLEVSPPSSYRYVRYLSPNGGYGNIAELQFYGTTP